MAKRVYLIVVVFLGIGFSLPADLHLSTQEESSQIEVAVTPVRGGVHIVTGIGGNVAAFVGEDGVFLVDAGLSQLTERLLASIQKLCGRESANPALRYVVNTHWHSDHTGGNETFAAAGALVVAHENVLRLLSQDQVMAHLGDRLVPAVPTRARPRLTFNDRMNLSWNQDLIHVVHVPNAHSNGDVIVHFRDADLIHMGDILNGNYPFIDVDFEGHIGGIIRAVEEVLAHSIESTLFIPGHGPMANREDLLRYKDMLTTVRDRVQAMIDRGMTRQEVIEAKPTADLDAVWSGGESADPFVESVYDGMVRSRRTGARQDSRSR
ncbi:MAG: MBL fold metallo-hydrolase [Gemmatimonadota bacterium]|nr:MAG: MBL fold metallo-hydrolase [Gemmatimonadota bacterium]